MVTYEFRGFGVMRANYTLSPEALVVELPGPQVGKSMHEARVPVAAIRGFTVAGPVVYRGAGPTSALQAAALNTGNNVMGVGGQLIVAWSEGERIKRRAWTMVNVNDPQFATLLAELARLRPDADLRALPLADAKARMGMWSDQRKALAFIVGVFVFLAIVLGVNALIQSLG